MATSKTATSTDLTARGYHIVEAFLSAEECARLLAAVEAYRGAHPVAEIYRPARDRPLRYSVINGVQISEQLPEVDRLYRRVNELVNQVTGEQLVPLEDPKVACNINITTPGGSYRWHYDRNAITAILYLNDVVGGETDCYPNYRLFLPKLRYSRVQRWCDALMQLGLVRRLLGRLVVVKPHAGTLFIMRGNRSLHSVRPVTSSHDRINIIMSYDVPGQRFAVANQLDTYLYSQQGTSAADPNYK